MLKEKVNILIIDPSKNDSAQLQMKLLSAYDEGCNITTIEKFSSLSNFKDEKFHFVFSECMFPEKEPIESIKTVLGVFGKETPVLVFSFYDDAKLALEAVKLGAHDYMLKGLGTEKTYRRIIDFAIERANQLKELNKIKKDLQYNNENLENIVATRTEDLRKANLAKTIFFANVTHELRTPLHAVINLSSFGFNKFETADREKLRDYFSDINKSGKRLLNLVNDVLDFTKVQISNLGLNIKKFSLKDVEKIIEQKIFTQVRTLLNENNQEVKLVNDAGDGVVYFDSEKFEQIMLNLISNAIKYASESGVITVKIEKNKLQPKHSNSDEGIAFKVIDEGKGIFEDELQSVFDEFYQSQKKIKTGSYKSGTGLGLSISRQLVMAHNGRIWVENNKDKGCTFTFTMPIRKQDLPPMSE